MEINKRKLLAKLNLTFKNENKSLARLWVSTFVCFSFDVFMENILSFGGYSIFVQSSTATDDGDLDMDKILGFLGERIVDPDYTECIGRRFEDILPLILKENVNYEANADAEFLIQHRKKCIALAKLVAFSPHAQRFTLTYFDRMPAPFFGDHGTTTKKKIAKTTNQFNAEPSKLDILKCCYTFLQFDTTFFVRQWKWSELIEKFGDFKSQNDEYKLIFNHILAHLTNMTQVQLAKLNEQIPVEVQIDFASKPATNPATLEEIGNFDGSEKFQWNLKNEQFVNIEGVLLPIFDAKNATLSESSSNIVMVNSARSNLKSIAIGVAAGKAVCLSGSVGSGKTTLIEYLASRTGRIPLKPSEHLESDATKSSKDVANKSSRSSKRKAIEMEKSANNTAVERKSAQNGFLRIQLGDQTDSKMLLGQYHCTDVPGEFVWQPGVLTQAVMNGYWLLLEDLDQCSRDVCVMLTNFFENNYLSVPGFRDCIQISSGFQLFVTRRYAKFFKKKHFDLKK